MNRRVISSLAVGIAALGVVASAWAATKSNPPVVVATENVKYFPLDPNNPGGLQIGVVEGDPTKGDSAFFLKIKPGTSPMHLHSASYYAVLISGTAKHWSTGDQASAPALQPGSFWYQPGKQAHGDACVSTEDCVVFLRMEGKFDFIPAGVKKG